MACSSITALSRECGKNTKTGVKDNVFLIAHSDLKVISGSTEVYATAASGLISAINVTSGVTFQKYGAVQSQNSIKEDYTYNDNGTYDIVKTLTFSLNNVGSVAAKTALENLIANPVAALVKLSNGTWVVFGLNGQLQMKTAAGEVTSAANGRVITLTGSDTEFLQVVDPTIISTIATL